MSFDCNIFLILFIYLFFPIVNIFTEKPADQVKAAKFLQPVVFTQTIGVRDSEKPPFQIALFLFQSTGPCNIITVNAVHSSKCFIRKKKRGRNEDYYHCVLEENSTRVLYC